VKGNDDGDDDEEKEDDYEKEDEEDTNEEKVHSTVDVPSKTEVLNVFKSYNTIIQSSPFPGYC